MNHLSQELRKIADSIEETQKRIVMPSQQMSLAEVFIGLRALGTNDDYITVQCEIGQYSAGDPLDIKWAIYNARLKNRFTFPTLEEAYKACCKALAPNPPPEVNFSDFERVLMPAEELPL
jgi:hypothetical protein